MIRRAALVIVGAIIVACAAPAAATPPLSPNGTPSPSPAARSTPTPVPTPTPTPVVRWPLTGAVAEDPAAVLRRPVNVRLPNEPAARPQQGLAKADLVFEMIVEGGVTRLAAIFHSRDPQAVGPVRSLRFSDIYITTMLRGAIVASGSSNEEHAATTRAMRAGALITVDADRVGAPYYRVARRPAPNNMFVNMAVARQAVNNAGGGDPVDVPPLRFLAGLDHVPTAGGFVGSVPATEVTIPFQREPAVFTWDAGSHGYRRSQSGLRTVDPDGGVPILARNVIVMHTDIWHTDVVQDVTGALGLDYRMTGGGPASIFRDGRRQDGTWKRDGALDQFRFFNAQGGEIHLVPGQSWIHFAYPDWVVTHSP